MQVNEFEKRALSKKALNFFIVNFKKIVAEFFLYVVTFVERGSRHRRKI